MVGFRKMEFNRGNVERVVRTFGMTPEQFFLALPAMMEWNDERVIELLGFEME